MVRYPHQHMTLGIILVLSSQYLPMTFPVFPFHGPGILSRFLCENPVFPDELTPCPESQLPLSLGQFRVLAPILPSNQYRLYQTSTPMELYTMWPLCACQKEQLLITDFACPTPFQKSVLHPMCPLPGLAFILCLLYKVP